MEFVVFYLISEMKNLQILDRERKPLVPIFRKPSGIIAQLGF